MKPRPQQVETRASRSNSNANPYTYTAELGNNVGKKSPASPTEVSPTEHWSIDAGGRRLENRRPGESSVGVGIRSSKDFSSLLQSCGKMPQETVAAASRMQRRRKSMQYEEDRKGTMRPRSFSHCTTTQPAPKNYGVDSLIAEAQAEADQESSGAKAHEKRRSSRDGGTQGKAPREIGRGYSKERRRSTDILLENDLSKVVKRSQETEAMQHTGFLTNKTRKVVFKSSTFTRNTYNTLHQRNLTSIHLSLTL